MCLTLTSCLHHSHLPPPPRRPSSLLPYLSFPIILSFMTFEISARGRSCFPWSVSFLDVFVAACSKVFRKASLRLMKEQVSRDVGGDESLASKSSLWESIYSARPKLKLISDQAGDLLKIVLKAGLGSCTSVILNKSTVSAKFTRDDLCGESESY